LKDEIWLLDFKTDDVRADELGDKLKQYEPQLRIYAEALERIHKKPVTKCWLHFLRAQKTVEL
jgi:ATP-dependent helicase/nuclease subunit A